MKNFPVKALKGREGSTTITDSAEILVVCEVKIADVHTEERKIEKMMEG